jgi:nitrite reductase/ring-hydroxylating ferredoxin subunit/alkylhydroperoxidase/carboxymuconolactone decarboxylase family protein YurZ
VEKPGDESRGLEFLKKARPRAIEHLLSFFGESSRHLDPRTRFLISVVTKVISGSKRGVRQYVKRAMENGAGAEEIIDAVLCAYPCAGLTKVVDAIDVILAMKIPGISLDEPAGAAESPRPPAGFPAPPPPGAAGPSGGPPATASPGSGREPRPSSASREWVLAARTSDLAAGGGHLAEVGGKAIALFQVDGEVFAVNNRCLHRGGSLAEGSVAGGLVTCPLHGWRFELRTGQCPARPGAVLETYPVRQEGDQIFVEI